jgi:MoxR-like ATPase
VSSPSFGQPLEERAAARTSGQLGNQAASKLLGDAIAQVQRVIVGQEHMVEQLMVALLAQGH